MFTHEQIWAAIDRLAESRGFSASGLARQAGLDPTAFNRSKRISPNGKPRWPSTESLAKILAVTDCTMSDLIALMDRDESPLRSVPVLPVQDVRKGAFSADPGPGAERITIALESDADDVFAIRVEGTHLHPLFRNGAVLVAARDVTIRAQDRVLFHTRDIGLRAGIVQPGPKRSLSVLLPGDPFDMAVFAEDEIDWTARILWSSQ